MNENERNDSICIFLTGKKEVVAQFTST